MRGMGRPAVARPTRWPRLSVGRIVLIALVGIGLYTAATRDRDGNSADDDGQASDVTITRLVRERLEELGASGSPPEWYRYVARLENGRPDVAVRGDNLRVAAKANLAPGVAESMCGGIAALAADADRESVSLRRVTVLASGEEVADCQVQSTSQPDASGAKRAESIAEGVGDHVGLFAVMRAALAPHRIPL